MRALYIAQCYFTFVRTITCLRYCLFDRGLLCYRTIYKNILSQSAIFLSHKMAAFIKLSLRYYSNPLSMTKILLPFWCNLISFPPYPLLSCPIVFVRVSSFVQFPFLVLVWPERKTNTFFLIQYIYTKMSGRIDTF